MLKLPFTFRLVFLGITALLAVSMASVGEISAVPAIIALFTLCGALYRETWIFDTESNVVDHIFGIGILVKRTNVDLKSIEKFALVNFREIPEDKNPNLQRKITAKSLVSLVMEADSGKIHTIEIRANKHSASLKENVEELSKFCGKPFEIQE